MIDTKETRKRSPYSEVVAELCDELDRVSGLYRDVLNARNSAEAQVNQLRKELENYKRAMELSSKHVAILLNALVASEEKR